MGIIKKIQDLKLDMERWRHRLHTEPELAFDERKTARFITRQLKIAGIDDVQTIAKTGLVAVIHGKNGPADRRHGGKAIMLRADMDALPIEEKTGATYASTTPGVHHACGHDGHMAMLMGAAKYLAETRNFDGTVYVVFQPAEEHIGGAAEMIKDGLFEKFPCDEVYGLHNFPGLPIGMMATGKGAILAQSDEYHITFRGTGGHSARPENASDVMGAAIDAASALKEIARQEIGDGATAIVSITAMHSDTTAANILPGQVTITGSIRTFDRDLHDKLKQRMEEAVAASADKHGAGASVEFKNGYPMLVNAEAETDFAIEVAREIVGEDKVVTAVPQTLGVEDFARFLEKKPGNFMAIGTGAPDGTQVPDLHTARYDFNDAALPVGASYWARLVEKALPVDRPAPARRPPAP